VEKTGIIVTLVFCAAVDLFFLGVLILLAWLIVSSIIESLDAVSRCPTVIGRAEVISKRFEAEHEEVYIEHAGGDGDIGRVIDTRTVSAHWTITIKLLGHRRSVEVSRAIYDSVKDGEPVEAEYRLGRISGWPYLKEIRPISSLTA
jgi:hypothetical protein